jgi:hypothetical protein
MLAFQFMVTYVWFKNIIQVWFISNDKYLKFYNIIFLFIFVLNQNSWLFESKLNCFLLRF